MHCVWVLGMGRSGIAAAQLLVSKGVDVTVVEQKPWNADADALAALGVHVLCGGDERTLPPHIDCLVKSPGIAPTHPLLAAARTRAVPIVSEIDIAASYWAGTLIAITGSNGKTTTTTLTHALLCAGGITAHLAGNIGIPLSHVVRQAAQTDVIVVELSSFQLEDTFALRAHIAAVLNIVPTHIDYHGTMERYVAAKKRIVRNQTADDRYVYPYGDDVLHAVTRETKAVPVQFSGTHAVKEGVGVVDGVLTVCTNDAHTPILPVAHLAMPGAHNVANAAAAAAMAVWAGVHPDVLRSVLRTFRGVEHRIEYVAHIDGVQYYNDSKSTNVTATQTALRAFGDTPVVLIAGGLDRGVPSEQYAPWFAHPLRALVAIGQTGPLLAQLARSRGVPCVEIGPRDAVDMMCEAVDCARALSIHGDIVLLSPGCASWDVYTSFEMRGAIYKKLVMEYV
jgi:UDP-N-acetylmuramoylalanine--D-glutamate ligase